MSGSLRTEHTSLCPGGVVEDPPKQESQPNTLNYTLESLVHLSSLWSSPHRGRVYWCPLCTLDRSKYGNGCIDVDYN